MGTVTIDNYYLSIALEAGVIGFVAYYGAFLAALIIGAKYLTRAAEQEDTAWLLPALLSIGCYIVIKSVLSQQENHPLAFAMLGMAVILIHRTRHPLREACRLKPAVSEAPAARTVYRR